LFKKNKKQNANGEMSFWEHLEALRWHFVRALFAVILLSCVAFYFNEFIFDHIILAPKNADFITNEILCLFGNKLNIDYFCVNNLNLKIINTSMSGQFTISIWISIIAGIIVAIPYILFEIWLFVKPALNENEKKHSRGFVWVTSFLFILGVVFSYFLIVPLTLNFLGTYKVSDNVENYISLHSYMNTVSNLCLATGLTFEFPILVYFLTKIGIITPTFLVKQRKIIIIIILIIGAIITPPDIISQIMISIPLYLLFEMSVSISKKVFRKKIKKA